MANLSFDRTAAAKDAPGSTGLPSHADSGAMALAEQLAREMADAWGRGERPLAEAFLERHPQLQADAEAAVRVIYEEICLRQEHEAGDTSQQVLHRFPQWQDQLRGLLDCIDFLGPSTAAPSFPAVGDTLGDFHVVAELGRGALGRVVVAFQESLADRPVVLKMTPRTGAEHLALARLQHTHIVPLYTAQDFPERNLRVLCMPYLGGAALAAVLAALAPLPVRQRSGRLVLEEVDRIQKGIGVAGPQQEKGRQTLAASSYEQALCRAAEGLARALQYAHERGMVHLDLKPSNILLSGDGEPLLLDFHLARGPVPAGERSPDWLGGTPGYMSPEQEAALDAVRNSRPVPAPVDGRSDIYSLGVLLHEALTGELSAAPAAAPLRARNPNVSVGLEDIVRKCLAPDPAGRYASAAALADDLHRHLEDRPLRGVPNRSPAERWRKWRRRSPHALVILLVSLALAGALLGACGLFLMETSERGANARRCFYNGQDLMGNGQYNQAAQTYQDGLEALGVLPGHDELRRGLERNRRLAVRADKVQKLHSLVETLRACAIVDGWSLRYRAVHAAACRIAWDDRVQLTDRAGSPLPRALEDQVTPDLADLILLSSDLRISQTPAGAAEPARREALAALDELEVLIGPHLVLARARQGHLERLGLAEEGRGAAPTREMAPSSAWEHCSLGLALLREGDPAGAARQLGRAAELGPNAFWPRFYGGVCAYRQGRHREALRAFDRSVGAQPRAAECHYYLGLTCAALGRKDEAQYEHSIALTLRPELGAAFLERGRLYAEQGRPAEALTDFRYALDAGADPALAWYHMGRVQAAQKQWAEARASLASAVRLRPDFKEAKALLATLGKD